MTDRLKALRDGAVLELVLDRPAGAASALVMDHALRDALSGALAALPHDIEAVLIRSGSRVFAQGPDLPSGEDGKAPDLATLCAQVAASPVPVFVLIEGVVAGALAEIALAAQGRLAVPSARIAFPGVALGLISGAGGTQRLARLVGAEQALRLMGGTQGQGQVAAAEALAIGLVDQVVDGADRDACLQATRDVVAHAGKRVAPDAGLRDGRAFLRAISAARAALPKGEAALPAEIAVIDCVEAALLLPQAQGLAFEAAVARDLRETPEAAALCHVHAAERRVAQMPSGLASFPVAGVAHLGVAGTAPGLAGVVLTALSRGVKVSVAATDRASLVQLLETVASRQEAAVQSGQLTEAQRDADWARLLPSLDAAALSEVDLLIAAPEAKLPPPRRGRPVLMTGRALLPEGTFRLVLTGRVAELGLPQAAPGQPAAQAWAFLRRLGLSVVLTGVQTPLGLSGRMAGASGQAVRALASLGVSPEAIVAALTGFGLPRPPVPEVADVPVRGMGSEEIVHRWLAALANEGAKLLSVGMAQSPLDIDLVTVLGLGFPRRRGGPLHQADQRGLLVVRRDLKSWAQDADLWKPVPAWDAFVSVGRGFAGRVTTG